MSHAPTTLLSRRHQQIRTRLEAERLDALVVTSRPNILYLTNFTGSSAILVVTPEGLEFITDFRYVTAVEAARATEYGCPGLRLALVEGSYDATLVARLRALGVGRVGFEAAHLSVARHAWLSTSWTQAVGEQGQFVATEGIVEHARVRKDEYEIRTIREAARRLSVVAQQVLADVHAGLTERDVAFLIDARIRKGGFERSAFDTIVASGANGALPHAHPGDRVLARGDLVVLDFGGVYDSYCVDLTRTVSIGTASERARFVYDAVRDAHDRAIAAVRPGISRFDIDAVARDTLGTHGLAEVFGHGTGHGLGLEVHEDPRLAKRRPDTDTRDESVLPGMVFTIEPGAYLPEWGGVRIEDDVLVTAGGVDLLTDVTTELQEL
jgi:Xaa-Pro aminopeptidase